MQLEEEDDEGDEGDGDDDEDDDAEFLRGAGGGDGEEKDFFNMEEMEKFADQQIDDDVNLLDSGDDEGDENAGAIGYDDFFDGPPVDVKAVADMDQNDSDQEDAAMSMFEKQNKDMQSQIKELETELLQPKKWTLTGEIDARKRPRESLLETNLDFDYAQRPAEEITEETTDKLEDIIRRRIIDESWDDPERIKAAKKKTFKQTEEVSAEKSSVGLAEIYEKEFLEQAKPEGELTVAEEKLNEAHQEIASLFSQLAHKLDALSDFHFAPKPPTEEIKIVSEAPAIAMEEIIPIGTSTAQMIAPEEEYRSQKAGAPQGETEATQAERKAKRRAKKRSRKKKNVAIDKASGGTKTAAKELKSILKNRHVRKGVNVDETNYGTSTSVFQKLTDAASATKNPFANDKKTKKGGKEARVLGPNSTEKPSGNFKL